MNDSLRGRIFSLKGRQDFDDLALNIFRHQAAGNKVYSEYISHLNKDISEVRGTDDIPFLPVGFFRSHKVITGDAMPAIVFESSGTTGNQISRHYITDTGLYQESLLASFRLFYGDPSDYFFAAILPSYHERGNSSLIYMVSRLIELSRDSRSGFYPDDPEQLLKTLGEVRREGKKAMLIGVSFALLDLAEKYSPDLSGITVVETGGMKGRRKEITREELHDILKRGLNIMEVHSEYGMTELLSQAWSHGSGIYRTPPWMKILIRDSYDPLTIITEPGITGGINVIDLANINSCSFIATGDLGRLNPDGTFEVLGRFDNSDIRGCSLLIG